MQKIDRPTVRAVENTAPGACKKDREYLYKKVQSGEIFGAFGEQERQHLWENVLSASANCLIPSFHTFFEDLNYIEGPLESLKRLVPLSRRDAILSALQRAYKGRNQESDSTIAYIPGTEADRVELCHA